MNRTLLLLLFSSLLFVACKDTEKSLTPLDIANTYYEALSNSNGEALKPLLSDTLYTKELDYDYEETFSKKQYLENWLKWDAMFDPTYEVLEIKQENQQVKATISKFDKRIEVLHETPTVWKETLEFENHKIARIYRQNVTFNDSLWEQNRNQLLQWVDEHHPELNGFIFDQTEAGGLNYLKALELYKNKK